MSKKHLPILYHFTCDHGHAGISRTKTLLPNIHPLMPGLGPVLWLTDLAVPPSRESVGLTSRWTTCDRLAYRYRVQTKAALHWRDIRKQAPKEVVETLESYGLPDHWWVVRRPLTTSEFSFDASYKRMAQGREGEAG